MNITHRLVHRVNVSRQTIDFSTGQKTWETVETNVPVLLVLEEPSPDPLATSAQMTQARSRGKLFTPRLSKIQPNDVLSLVRPAGVDLKITVLTDRAQVMGPGQLSHHEWTVVVR